MELGLASSLWRQFGLLLVRYKGRFFVAFLLVLAANLLRVANPLIFRRAVALFDAGGEPSLVKWAGLLVVVTSFASLFSYAMRVTFIKISRDAEVAIREEIFAKIQGQSQAFFDRHTIGGLMSRLTNDISVYREVVGPGIMYPTYFLTVVIPSVIALFAISPTLAWISLIPLFVLPPAMLAIRRVVFRYSRWVQESLAKMSSYAQEDYSGIRLVKCYGEEATFSRRFHGLCHEFLTLSLKLMAAENLFYPFLRMLGKGVTVALVLVAGYIILEGRGWLSAADLVSFMWVQSYLLVPVMMLGWIMPLYQRGRGAYSRLYDLYCESNEVADVGRLAQPLAVSPSIEFREVSFTYPDGAVPAVDDVSFKVGGGQIIGITGPPGGGKSTLFHLLTRDYPLATGSIVMEGKSIDQYAIPFLRAQMGVVEQEPFLFSRTLAENISLGRQGDVEEAAQAAQIAASIASFPAGYETLVGERGVTLSGGQRQRVALARAFFANTPILLLDDVFSALDANTAEEVFNQLRAMPATILLITHRVPILQKVDQVIYMSHGRVTEQGTPGELAQAGGQVAALFELATLEG